MGWFTTVDGVTTCQNGHVITSETVTIVGTQARRRCRECHKIRNRKSIQKAKAARNPKPCEGCGISVDQTKHTRHYCSKQCASNTRRRRRYQQLSIEERRARYPNGLAPISVIPCESCGLLISRRGEENKRFCPACRPGKGHLSRARRYGVLIERFDKQAVYDRDGWVCQLCHLPVDRDLSWPDLGSASLDHRIPLSRGGAHAEGNVQLAHLGCNIGKGAS